MPARALNIVVAAAPVDEPEPYAAPVVMSLVLDAFFKPVRKIECQFCSEHEDDDGDNNENNEDEPNLDC